MSDKLEEALIKVSLKIAFAPLPFGRGWGRGAATAKTKANYLCARAFSPRGIFFGYLLVAAPLCASRTSFTFQTGDMVYTFGSSRLVVAAVGTVEKRLLFFHGFHSPFVSGVHLAPCQAGAGLMVLVLSSSTPSR